MLIILILGMGATYARRKQTGQPISISKLKELETRFLSKVEENFLEVFGDGEIESVQIALLLGSHYLYHRQPKKAFAVLGAGLKSAQAQGLHQEHSWGQIDPIVREVRRRIWLALVVGDRSVSPDRPQRR